MYLIVSLSNTSQNVLLYQWLNNEFRNLHQLPANEIKHMEAWTSGSDIYLIVAKGMQQKTNTEFAKYVLACLTAKAFGIKEVQKEIKILLEGDNLLKIILSK